jgi:NAD(P)H-nitrite reductase large subunit
VIVGNGAAGTYCAEALRKTDPNAEITLFTDEPYPLYNRVALPPFLRGKTPAQKVFLRTLEWHEKMGIKLHLSTRVERVDTAGRTVTTAAGDEYPYDALLVATGGRPNPLRVPGAEGTLGVMNFQYFDDAKAIDERIRESRSAVAYGGSFIAYELAEAFATRGLQVTWIMRGPYWLRRVLDPDGGALVDEIARQHGVEMVYEDEIAAVQRKDGVVAGVTTKRGRTIACDLLGVGLGMTWNTALLQGTPVEVQAGVVTNEYLETNVPGVYAAGDVAQFFDVTIQRYNQMGTWGNALGHGRIAARNMAGERVAYEDIPMYSSGLFDSFIRVIGLTPDAYPDLESWERLDAHGQNYQRLFFLEDRLVGAVLIGEAKWLKKIFAAIQSREPVPQAERHKLVEG